MSSARTQQHNSSGMLTSSSGEAYCSLMNKAVIITMMRPDLQRP